MIEISTTCANCGETFTLTKKSQVDSWRAKRNVYYSKDCSNIARARMSSVMMAATNRKYASARMKANNPMKKDSARLKMQATIKAIGHSPRVRGGNGKGPTVPQKMLAEALHWQMEYVIKTGHPRKNPFHYPTSYKIDIANPLLKIAIEVDGASHSTLARQAQDVKKTQFLTGQKWAVLRFTNLEVMEHLEDCVKTVMSTISKSKTSIPM
ncbi:endonuclease domain-containing protein [Ktedonobacter racemifer]|uniref:endonuclease domain-containing protein n=1 Tax=Ktedonobacter racemifer TaxID=363277 RepID=UPI003B75D005